MLPIRLLLPYVSLQMVLQSDSEADDRQHSVCDLRCLLRVDMATARRQRLRRTSSAEIEMRSFGSGSVSAVLYPAFCSVTASGPIRRPAAARSSASASSCPAGYGFPPNLVRKVRRKDFSGPSVNAELRHLGAGPTRLASPGVTRAGSGNSTNGDTDHVPEQSNPHRLPRQ